MDKIKNLLIMVFVLVFQFSFSQTEAEAKKLLDEVSTKMGAYENMHIVFNTVLVNKEAGINEGDEPPINGKITLQAEKYNLEYLGNTIIFNGKKLYVINHDDKEVSITEGDLDEEDGIIYPNKMLTFYKEGYNYKLGKMKNEKGRMLQHVELFPIDSNSEIVQVTLCIDKVTKHIYKLIQQGSNGAITTLTINHLKSNQEISPMIFTFNQKKYEQLDYLID